MLRPQDGWGFFLYLYYQVSPELRVPILSLGNITVWRTELSFIKQNQT